MTLYPVTDVSLSRYDPEELRRKVVEGGSDTFAEGLIEALKPRVHCPLCKQKSGYQRWAFVLFGKVAKLSDSTAALLIAVLQKYGVKDESEMGELVAAGRSMRQLQNDATASLEDFRDEGVELLALVLRERPEWRASVLARLGSEARLIEAHESDSTDAPRATERPPQPLNGGGDYGGSR